MSAEINASPTPSYSISVDGRDITHLSNRRLVSLTLTDCRGFEADTLELVLDDSDGALELPRKGAVVRVAIGWAHTGTVDKGSYVVDEVEHTGAPDQLTIRARSANLRESFVAKRDQSWHATTLGDMVATIAGRNRLSAAVDATLAAVAVAHMDQTNESDANFLSRAAELHSASASVKDARLILIPAGGGRTAGGQRIPALTIERRDGDQHRFAVTDRESYTGVRAYYFAPQSANRLEVLIPSDPASTEPPAANPTDPSALDADKIKTLRHTYANRTNALRAASAAWSATQRGVAQLTFQLALGRPDLQPEVPARLAGIKAQIDAVDWTITRVVHSLSDSGYTTGVEMEVKIEELPG